MNYTDRKQQLSDEFNKNQTLIQQAVNRNQQIIGQFQVIEELEKENKPEIEEVKEGEAK